MRYSFFKKTIMVLTFYTISVLYSSAATLYGLVSYPSIDVGGETRITWYLDTQGKSVNVIDGTLNFSTSTILVRDITLGNSLVSLWITKPTYSKESGLLTFTGGIPSGIKGIFPIFETTLEGVKEGSGLISIFPNSNVVLSDGNATVDSLLFPTLQINVNKSKPTILTSNTHPDRNVWYTVNNLTVSIPKDYQKYEYSFGNESSTALDKHLAIPQSGVIDRNDLPDGTYYLELYSASTSKLVDSHSFHIDKTPPESFIPSISSDETIFNGKDFISFTTVDKMSGVDKYVVTDGILGLRRNAISPAVIKRRLVTDFIKVTAYDRARNTTTESVYYPSYLTLFVNKIISLIR
jgi:hypothetical protein